jgi:excisionase family DNA binding protein
MEDRMQQRDDERFERLYKAEEAWTTLRISRPTFYRLVENGSLPVVRMGSAIRVTETVLREAVQKALPREKAAADMAPALHPQWSTESA